MVGSLPLADKNSYAVYPASVYKKAKAVFFLPPAGYCGEPCVSKLQDTCPKGEKLRAGVTPAGNADIMTGMTCTIKKKCKQLLFCSAFNHCYPVSVTNDRYNEMREL